MVEAAGDVEGEDEDSTAAFNVAAVGREPDGVDFDSPEQGLENNPCTNRRLRAFHIE